MKTVDLANNLYYGELEQDSSTSIPGIIFWLSANVGKLNNLIATSFVFDTSTKEFVPELSDDEAAIFSTLYLISFYERKIKNSLGAKAYDWSELREGDSVIRKVSNNEIAKTYRGVKNDLETLLDKLTFFYKQNKSIPVSLYSDYWKKDIYDTNVSSDE